MADQSKRIVFHGDDGSVSVLVPPHDGDCDLTLEQIIAISIPVGAAYKIIDVTDVPSDRSQRDAWSVDPADLTDGASQ